MSSGPEYGVHTNRWYPSTTERKPSRPDPLAEPHFEEPVYGVTLRQASTAAAPVTPTPPPKPPAPTWRERARELDRKAGKVAAVGLGAGLLAMLVRAWWTAPPDGSTPPSV